MSGTRLILGRPRARVAVLACVAVVALALDQGTKLLAEATLADGRTITVIPGLLALKLVHNPGASLGMGSGHTWAIALLAVAACVALVVAALRTVNLVWTAALSLAFAGAFGNLIDRIAYAEGFLDGKVVDFLDYGWSVGNVADIFLMAAGIAVVVLILLNVPFSAKDLATDGAGRDEREEAGGR
ncbi:signal peptidase II [Bifidobacterium pullorum subsp. saeculare]|uniref:Lipoprotein signal peptidase n=1 Tax=Bifidobacterium pullorum subsp. saeculare TaxID=78257 RepID=A0A938WUD8_9BIFI|nr:signal peptidase II [Bifidobacterium pullorum]MBM6698905.1 signal peptidase II [Bifidobacterium pullorum subsp. saeculare]